MSPLPSQTQLSLVDSHAHLDMSRFDPDRDEVVRRAAEAGVANIITVGIDLISSRKAIGLAQHYPNVRAAVGIHPQETKDVSEKEIKTLSTLAQEPGVVAIGEIGLEFNRGYAAPQRQLEVLEWQLALADELHLPVIIHSREAEMEMVAVLSRWTERCVHRDKAPGVIHCFSGSLETAETYIKLGFFVSVGAYIGYPSSRALREVVKRLPVDRLLIETDCPFLPPQSRRGQRNEPAFVLETARTLADIRGIGLEEAASSTSANAARLFGLDETLKE